MLLFISCKAQNIIPPDPITEIIPIENYLNYWENEIEIPDNAYIKDVNNLLNKYIGTWSGTYNNKTYEFFIQKITRESDIRPLIFDELVIRYRITASDNTILEDTSNLPDSSPFIVNGWYITNNNRVYVLNYVGEEAECGQEGNIFIEVSPTNLNQMKLFLQPTGDIILLEDCPLGEAQQLLPINSIVLDKQ